MTLSIRTTLRSLSVLALTAAFLPGCDGEEYEALGLSSEEIDAMSEEELDHLAALEGDDDLGHSVDHKQLSAALPGPHPVPSDDLGTNPPADEPIGPDTLVAPMHPTHNGKYAVDVPDTLWDPQHTHNGKYAVDVPDTLWDPQHTHTENTGVVAGLAVPTLPDPGCQPYTELPQLTNG